MQATYAAPGHRYPVSVCQEDGLISVTLPPPSVDPADSCGNLLSIKSVVESIELFLDDSSERFYHWLIVLEDERSIQRIVLIRIRAFSYFLLLFRKTAIKPLRGKLCKSFGLELLY